MIKTNKSCSEKKNCSKIEINELYHFNVEPIFSLLKKGDVI